MSQPAEDSSPDPQALSPRRTHLGDQPIINFTPNSSSSSDRRRETLKLLNSRMERVGKRREQEEKDVEEKGRSSWPNSGRADLAFQCFKSVETHPLMKSSCECEETLAGKNDSCELELPLVVESGNYFPSVARRSSSSTDLKSIGSPLTSLSLSASLMGSYAQLPSPQLSCAPLTHRLKSAGDILFSKRKPSKTNMENLAVQLSSTPRRPVTQSHVQLGPTQHRETDRQSHYQRSPPAPLNQSYDVENPSPSLLRPQISSGPEPLPAPVRHRLQHRGWLQGPLKDSTSLGRLNGPHTLPNKAG